jgi:hypothetical protein
MMLAVLMEAGCRDVLRVLNVCVQLCRKVHLYRQHQKFTEQGPA